jgi:uncharacterized protein (TIGR03437 family)
MLPGGYALNLVFENPEHPEVGTSSVRVVLALNNPGLPEIGSVTSATSMRPGISPGQLVTIRGAHLSSPPVIGEADSAGVFPKAISNTRVRFNGIAAPLLYVSNDQINCVVPYGVAGSTEAQVVVDRMFPSGLNETSKAVTVAVRDTSPGIFTVDASGGGPGAIVNSGARTGLNSQENPAPGGSGITFYATGAGIWNVAYPDGSLVLDARLGLAPPSPEFLAPVAPVSVMVGGQPAKVVMAIAQRMRVSGMLEVTVEIPAGLEPGAQPLVLKIGENDNADQNVTVWVQ